MASTPRFHTLVFDILGSLLDEDAGMVRVAAQIVGPAESGAFVTSWSELHRSVSSEIRAARRPYLPLEVLHAEAIQTVAQAHGSPLTDEHAERLAWFGRELAPFDDVTEALDSLAEDHRLVGLTNAGLTQAFEMSGFAGLRWTSLISSEQVRTFKPDPRMYAFAIEKLGLEPESCLFVAAHPWDLDAAAQHGFRTAYIDRSASTSAEMDAHKRRFDHAEPDLGALSRALRGVQ